MGENYLVKLNGCGVEDIQKGFAISSEPVCCAVDKIICQIGLMDIPDDTVPGYIVVTLVTNYS